MVYLLYLCSMKRNCLNCGKEFEAKRETAKFHNTSCRVMFSRKNKGNQKKDAEKSFLVQVNVALNSLLEMVGKINYGVVPTNFDAPRVTDLRRDEPKQWQEDKYLPTFQDLLNGMTNVQFSDDKEDYAEKIRDATHLTEKQRSLLISNLWAKN